MKLLLILLCASFGALAQVHQSLPVPQILDKSKETIEEDIIGWSLSLDGQWVSEDMKIPVRAVAQNEDAYERDNNQLGLDNISELIQLPILYGQDTLCALIKIMESGYYKYKTTKQKWQSTNIGYYYIFDKHQLARLHNLENGKQLIKIPLRDFGSLGEVKVRNLKERLQQTLVIKPKTDQLLMAAIMLDDQHPDKVYFQFSSQHNVFTEVEGVVKDFKLNGRTIYGTPLLLDYLHYEYDKNAFLDFFKIH